MKDSSEQTDLYVSRTESWLSSIHEEGSINEKKSPNISSGLKAPSPAPRIKMNEPGFDNLTNAEKLNDRDYRDLIYRQFPDEPTCACGPPIIGCCVSSAAKKRTKKLFEASACRYGCTGRCCSTVRRNDVNNVRLRGGGKGSDLTRGHDSWDHEFDFAWHNKKYPVPRLEGGACDGQKVRVKLPKSTGNKLFEFDDNYLITKKLPSRCKRFNTDDWMSKPSCRCPDDETLGRKISGDFCTKNPCLGADCFVRAFKDVQDFVDSLGKVPGCAGLGLMDPLESPFFGRPKEPNEIPIPSDYKRTIAMAPPLAQLKPKCSTPFNPEGFKNTSKGLPDSYTTAVPGRNGIVREAIPLLPDLAPIIIPGLRGKKKEDRFKDSDAASNMAVSLEVGPCGEPKCRSRRKKQQDTTEVLSLTEQYETKSTSYAKSSNTLGKSDKHSSSKSKAHLAGPSGDRKSKISVAKPKRLLAHFGYSFGDVYPGMGFGHKSCVQQRTRVPRNMGWLWNQPEQYKNLKPRVGWKPGSINVYLREALRDAKAGFFQGHPRPRSAPSRHRKGKPRNSISYSSVKKILPKKKDGDEEEVEPPPTLHIQRKDGVYYVTMYPIKQDTMDVPQLEQPTKPLQFKIAKSKDSLATSSTASDMEIEFSPPAAVNRYRRKPDVVHVDTQVKQQEIVNAFRSASSKESKISKGQKKEKGKKR